MFVRLDRQVSYNGPLPNTPSNLPPRPQMDLPLPLPSMPCTLASKSLPTVPINHPLPPKPVSQYFIPAIFPPTRASVALSSNLEMQVRSDGVTKMDKANHLSKGAVISNRLEPDPLLHILDTCEVVPHKDITDVSHGPDDCEIIDVDELDEFDDLLHPDTLFSRLWNNDISQNSCETSGKPLCADAAKTSSPEITRQDGQDEFQHHSAPGAQVNEDDSGTAPSLGESFSNVYNSCRSDDDKENMQENTDRIAPLPCNNQDEAVDIPGKENNHPAKRLRGNGRESQSLDTTPLQMRPAPDQRTELRPPKPTAEGTRLLSMATEYPSNEILAQPVCQDNLFSTALANCYVKTTRVPRTRARARAEAAPQLVRDDATCPLSSKTQLYSEAEDKLLRNLVEQGLPWNEVEKAFCQRFPGRNLRSLQMRWSRKLKFAVPLPSARCSQRKRRHQV